MAIYFFEEITAAQALSYTPSDVLVFTTPGLTASQVSVTFVPFTATTPDFITLTAPGKVVTFNDPGGYRGELDSAFSDGSLLYAGTTGNDNVTGTGGQDGLYGGTGEVFDWEVASGFRREHPELPVLLAGGIVPENAGLAAMSVQPAALDIASGAEVSPGIKDFQKVAAFLTALHRRPTC